MFFGILKLWNLFDFLDFFESPGCTGQSFFRPKNQPKNSQAMFFGNVFGQFWKFRRFSFFQSFFQASTLQGALAISFLEKSYLKTCSEHAWTLMGKVLDFLELLKFSIFPIFSFLDPPGCTGQNFYRKNDLETCSKHVWSLLGTIFGHFEKLKVLPVLLMFFQVSTLQGALRKNFSRKDYREACSKRVWTFLRMFLGILKKNESFSIFFEIFPSLDLPGCTEHFFSEKITSNQVWTLLETFFFRGSETLKYFHFLWIFLSLQGALGIAFFRRNNQAKHA